jgi:endonuclease V-like protein UPF0215 family
VVDKKAEAYEMDKTDGVDVTSKVENMVNNFVDQIRHSVTAKKTKHISNVLLERKYV